MLFIHNNKILTFNQFTTLFQWTIQPAPIVSRDISETFQKYFMKYFTPKNVMKLYITSRQWPWSTLESTVSRICRQIWLHHSTLQDKVTVAGKSWTMVHTEPFRRRIFYVFIFLAHWLLLCSQKLTCRFCNSGRLWICTLADAMDIGLLCTRDVNVADGSAWGPESAEYSGSTDGMQIFRRQNVRDVDGRWS